VIAIRRQKALSKCGAQRPAHILTLAKQMGILDQSLMDKNRIGEVDTHRAAKAREDGRFAENLRRAMHSADCG
jgi:hypothetical protein